MREQLFSSKIHVENPNNLVGLFKMKERLTVRYLESDRMLVVMGRSVTLEVLPVYTQLNYQVRKHFLQYDKLSCFFHYSVINASTTKLLFNLFSLLNSYSQGGKHIVIHWVIDDGDEELFEVGSDFKEVFDLDFRIITR